jgi:ankyrin repeat protein
MGCLVDAVRRGDVQEVARLLAAGADPNVKDLDGHTPLHIAAEQCRADLAELLLRHGADPNAKNVRGKTPLHRAVWERCGAVVQSFCLDTALTLTPGMQTERRLCTRLCR